MSTKIEEQKSSDWWKWTLCVLLLATGFYANYHFLAIAGPVRVIAWIVLMAILGFIAAQTHAGSEGIKFLSDSRMEMRKVVWPNRQEVTRSTLVILALVGICGVFLWLLDAGLIGIIGWLTGQRG